MNRAYRFEACVESAAGAIAAEQGGADRVELCADLAHGGCTPSPGAIEVALARLSIPVHVMIRPRGGDFCHDRIELDGMQRDIAAAKARGAHGVVLGVLHPDGTVDAPTMRRLIEQARPMSVTFHRAFDICRDPFEALASLIQLGVDRVLTSGGAPSALEGVDTLRRLVERAEERLIVMPGAGIRETNLRRIIAGSGAREFHARAAAPIQPRMTHHPPRNPLPASCLAWDATDSSAVRRIVEVLRQEAP